MEHFHFHSKVHLLQFHLFRHKSHDLFPRVFFHGSSSQGGGTSATVFLFDCLANGELHEAKREGSGDTVPTVWMYPKAM